MSADIQQKRREERVDLHVRASVHSQPGSGVVRLCNMSPIGALIEGETLPLVGYEVELRRGALAVPGKIVWRSEEQAGVSFSRRTVVEDWFPDAEPQQTVDNAFQRIMEEMRERGPVRDIVLLNTAAGLTSWQLAQDPEQLRLPITERLAANMAVAVLNDEEPEVNDTETYDNDVKVVPSYLLAPVPVVKDNVESVLVDSGYWTKEELGL